MMGANSEEEKVAQKIIEYITLLHSFKLLEDKCPVINFTSNG